MDCSLGISELLCKDISIESKVAVLEQEFKFDFKGFNGLVCYLPEVSWLLFGTSANTIRVWDCTQNSVLSELKGHTGCISCIYHTHKYIISSSEDSTIRLWNIKTMMLESLITTKLKEIVKVLITDDEQYLIINSWYGQIEIKDLKQGSDLDSFNIYSKEFWVLENQYLVYKANKFTAKIYNLKTQNLDYSIKILENILVYKEIILIADKNQISVHKLHDSNIIKRIEFLSDENIAPVLLKVNDKYLITSYNQVVSVWDTLRFEQVKVFEDCYQFIQLTEDWIFLEKSFTISVWNLESDEMLGSLNGHLGKVRNALLSHDAKYLASSSADNTIIIWDIPTLLQIHCIECLNPRLHCFVSSTSIVYSGNAGTLDLFYMPDLKHTPIISGHENKIYKIIQTLDNKYLITIAYDWYAIIWDMQSKKFLSILGKYSYIVKVIQTPDYKYLLALCEDSSLIVWNMNSLMQEFIVGNFSAELKFAIIKNNKYFIYSGISKVSVWDPLEDNFVSKVSLSTNISYARLWKIEDNKYLITGDDRGNIKLYDLNNLSSKPRLLTGHRLKILCIYVSPDNSYLISSSLDNTILFFSLKNFKRKLSISTKIPVVSICYKNFREAVFLTEKTFCVHKLEDFTRFLKIDGVLEIQSIKISNTNEYILTGTKDGYLDIWSVETKKLYKDCRIGKHLNYPIEYIKQTGKLISFDRYRIHETDVKTGSSKILIKYDYVISNMLIHPNGKYLIYTLGADLTVTIYSLEACAEIEKIENKFKVLCLDVSQDFQHLITGSNTHLQVWDLSDKMLLGAFLHKKPVVAVFYDDFKKQVASATSEKIFIWDIVSLNVILEVTVAFSSIEAIGCFSSHILIIDSHNLHIINKKTGLPDTKFNFNISGSIISINKSLKLICAKKENTIQILPNFYPLAITKKYRLLRLFNRKIRLK
jgi:WD40 repeat protein